MLNRYLATMLLTSLLSAPAPAATKKAHPSRAAAIPAANASLYSKRALRRAKLLLEMQMLELKKARLDRVRDAIRRNLPPDLRN